RPRPCPRLAAHPVPAPSTTPSGPPASSTTPPCASSATGSSASCTDASRPAPSTTSQPPGPTAKISLPLDIQAPGMSFQAGHIPSWRGSCECYALPLVAGGGRWLLLLLSAR